VAVVPSKDKLQVTVDLAYLKKKNDLAYLKKKKLPASVQIELRDGKGKVVAKARGVAPKERPDNFRCEIPAANLAVRQLKLVCRFQGNKLAVPVRRVLLAKAHETALTAGTEFFAGSTAALRCDVHAVKSITDTVPLPGSRVQVTLRAGDGKGKTHKLFRGKTGQDGILQARFKVPQLPTGQYLMEVTTRSPLGEEKLQRQVQVKTDAKILLVTDKPLYQPGQIMHIRALSLRPFDLKPVATTELVFEVEDGKGNKVFKRSNKTSAYGIATADFELADEVNMGSYTIRAIMGQQQAQKTVTVKQYVLPKFKVNLTTDKSFYLPKETVKAELQTDYFFGKPVAKGKVKVTASTFDVAFKTFQTWEGTTDAQGHAKFEIRLPAYFVGQPLQKGNALVKLEVKVTDTADHAETINRTYPVSDQSIRVSLIPEGGRLVPGMENRVYAAAIYPDGNPAVCTIDFWMGREAKGEALTRVKTNASGLAEFTIKPKAEQFRAANWEVQNVEMLGGTTVQSWGQKQLLDMTLKARDAKGDVTQTVAELNSLPFGENVLLRLNKAIYKPGDTIEADIRTSAGLPTVYLDVIKNGQTLLTRWLDVTKGKAQHDLDLPQNIFGTLEVHAYQMLRTGEIIRDSRVVYVQPRNDLKIAVKADKQVHQPGENGTIHFQVTDAAGKPTAAALGVIIVDEAVYALQEMQPGLEKVYFTLQEELLKPQVQMAFQPNVNINQLILRPALPAPKQQIAQVLLTAVQPKAPARWQVAPEIQRQQQLDGQVQQIGWALYNYGQGNSVLAYDKENKSWDFKAGLLQDMVKARHLNEATLNDPVGGKLTLRKLAKLEKNFTAERLARTTNNLRMYQLGWAFLQETGVHRNDWLKDGKWTFPKTVLKDAAKRFGYNENWLNDVWGKPYRLVKLKKKQDHKSAYSQLDYYRIVSAGPDGKFGTEDDVVWSTPNNNPWQSAQWWWTSDSTRLAKKQPFLGWRHRGFARRELLMQNFAMDRAAKGGLMPPMAAGAGKFKQAAEGKKFDGGPQSKAGGAGGGSAPPVRVREYFPETLRWEPAIITDDQGRAALSLTFADSITTWRLSASASSKGGGLGGVSAPLRVFQDFFVDLDLPVSLTQNDEVAFPVAVYNYLKTPQTVKLVLKKAPWFELTDQAGFTRSLDLKPNEVTAVKFRIRARQIGSQPLEVKAYGSKLSDAIRRTIEVVPDGKRIERVVTDRLKGKVTQTIDIPPHALPDASKLMVKLYPGVVSQILEGAEGMLRLPGG
jgi:hypothetical protein